MCEKEKVKRTLIILLIFLIAASMMPAARSASAEEENEVQKAEMQQKEKEGQESLSEPGNDENEDKGEREAAGQEKSDDETAETADKAGHEKRNNIKAPLMKVQTLRGEQSSVITRIRALLKDGSGPVVNVGQWQTFRISVDFAIPDGQVHEGDTTVIKNPDKLYFYQGVGFQIKDSEGNVIANASINGGQNTLTLTYTDYAETHSDVQGSFYFYVNVDRTKVSAEEDIPLDFDVSGRTMSAGSVHFEGIQLPVVGRLEKVGYHIPGGKRTLRFQVKINAKKESIKNAVLKDQLISPGVEIDPSSFTILKGDWEIENSDYVLKNTTDVTGNYHVEYNADHTSYQVSLGDIGENDGLIISYNAITSYDLVDGERIGNEAELVEFIGDGSVSNKTAYATFYESGGTGEGYVYSLKIKKSDGNGHALAGASFNIVRVSNGAVAGTVTTDSNGEAELKGLLKDDYQLIEMKAPAGYRLLTTPVEVSKSSFGTDKTAVVNVKNVPIKEDPPKPPVVPPSKPAETSVKVKKIWEGKALDKVTVRLTADGTEKTSAELSAANGWETVFTNLPVNDERDGHKIIYGIKEDPVDGYTSGISGTQDTGFTITNTEKEKVSVPVTKIWKGTKKDKVTVRLLADGTRIGKTVLSAANGWQHTFTGLEKYGADGHEIRYSVSEDAVNGYTSTISGDPEKGFTVMNTKKDAKDPKDPGGKDPVPKDPKDPPRKPGTEGIRGHFTPKTGDTAGTAAYAAAMITAAVLMAALWIAARRKRKDRS